VLTQDDNPALWLSFSGEDGSDIRNLTQRVSDYFGCPVFVLIEESEPLCLVTGPATSTSLVPEQQENCELCGTNVSLDDLAPLFPDCSGHARYCWNCLAKLSRVHRAKLQAATSVISSSAINSANLVPDALDPPNPPVANHPWSRSSHKSWFGYPARPTSELNVPFKCPNPACTGNVPMWAIRKCVGENDFRR